MPLAPDVRARAVCYGECFARVHVGCMGDCWLDGNGWRCARCSALVSKSETVGDEVLMRFEVAELMRHIDELEAIVALARQKGMVE